MIQNKPSFDWNQQFEQQASWTRQLREYLFQQLGITGQSNLLEIGCGTGAILRETAAISPACPIGIDNNFARLTTARKLQPSQDLATSDASALPFCSAQFDFVLSHYFWLWAKNPDEFMRSVWRVLKPGGKLVCLAEPDYAARIEHPAVFLLLGKLQQWALHHQGAITSTGRKLPEMLANAGFSNIQFGLSGFQKPAIAASEAEFAAEWHMLQYDLNNIFPKRLLNLLMQKDWQARESGKRVSWVPTFYAIGEKST